MEMGSYCKAYLAQQLRAYPGWSENKANARLEKQEVDGKEVELPRELDDDSILYLQENYVVTDGIFIDENVIFDEVSDAWKQFCRDALQFEIPVYEPIDIPSAQPDPPDSPSPATADSASSVPGLASPSAAAGE